MFTGLILSGLLAAATQQPLAPGPANPPSSGRPDPAFSHLFAAVAQGDSQPARPAAPRRAKPRAKIVCGMTLLFVGPEGDPTMTKPAPKDHVTYTIRRYPPPACGDEHR